MRSDPSDKKVTASHLAREAWIYVRQSTLRQVADNTESAQRQYAMKQRALALGWSSNRVHVMDDDQGKSGASSENRSGFRDLLGRVANGEVGAVISIEVSRLSRDNADWHQLLRIASLADTLIVDESGTHDPGDINDRLLLGIKGTLSEFELLGIRARMLGGLKNAAKRGALKLNLPVGLVYNDQDEVVMDPDQSIVDAIGGVFSNYRRLGSCPAVVRWMHQENLMLPSRRPHQRAHPGGGQVRWGLPTMSQIGNILKNPRYAGTYVYGRRRSEKQPDGTTRKTKVRQDQWQVCIPQAHIGYIDWDEYNCNQAQAQRNVNLYAASGARNAHQPRDGEALLRTPQIICGRCGQTMRPVYKHSGSSGCARYYYRCRGQRQRDGSTGCQMIRGDCIDTALGEFIVALINQNNIELALAVEQQVREEFAQADAQRAQCIERLRYKANQAQRRFYAVDPENRHVAEKLETDWNQCLNELDDAVAERQAYVEQLHQEMSEHHRARIVKLSEDFSNVWNASTTKQQDRKQLLGLLIEDVTLTRQDYTATVQVRLRGGLTTTLGPLELPKPPWMIRKTAPETITRIRQLSADFMDCEIAEKLNAEGFRAWNNANYTARKVQFLRKKNAIAGYVELQRQQLRNQGFVTAGEIAEQLGTTSAKIHQWGKSSSKPWLEIADIRADSGKCFKMYIIKEQNTAETSPLTGSENRTFVSPTQGAL